MMRKPGLALLAALAAWLGSAGPAAAETPVVRHG